MIKIAVIGTAGRKEDAKKINRSLYFQALMSVGDIILSYGTDDIMLVSGAAAFADHMAVSTFEGFEGIKLRLHLPAKLTFTGFEELSKNPLDAGRVSNYYHNMFSESCHIDSLGQLRAAIKNGAEAVVTPGFKNRNTKVAMEADVVIALTFGHNQYVKDGGTKDTCRKYLELGKTQLWHIDLNTIKTWQNGTI